MGDRKRQQEMEGEGERGWRLVARWEMEDEGERGDGLR